MTKEKEQTDKLKEGTGLIKTINDQIRALEKSEPIYKPDPHAGYLLVDPVVVAALSYWWEKLKANYLKEGK